MLNKIIIKPQISYTLIRIVPIFIKKKQTPIMAIGKIRSRNNNNSYKDYFTLFMCTLYL